MLSCILPHVYTCIAFSLGVILYFALGRFFFFFFFFFCLLLFFICWLYLWSSVSLFLLPYCFRLVQSYLKSSLFGTISALYLKVFTEEVRLGDILQKSSSQRVFNFHNGAAFCAIAQALVGVGFFCCYV